MISNRLVRRLIRHHLPLALAVGAASAALYVTRPYPDVISRLSFASAYPALVLLAATLMVGPARILAAAPLAISIDLRRDLGIWAGLVGFFHAAVGQCMHLRGRPWLYYIYGKSDAHVVPLRHDAFGLANYTGLLATLILLALLATSNDLSLRRLGTPSWKRLQRWNYGCFALTAAHCFLYQLGVESQKLPFVALAALTATVTVAAQIAGYRRRAARR